MISLAPLSRASTITVPTGNFVAPCGGRWLMYCVRGPSTEGGNVPSSGGPSSWNEVHVRNAWNVAGNATNVSAVSGGGGCFGACLLPHAARHASAHATAADHEAG